MSTVTPFSSDFNHVRPEIGDDVDLLVNLDPVRHRIILQHWFGVESFQPVDPMIGIVANVRSRRNLERVHRDGVRPIGELLDELAREYGLSTVIEQKLEVYASLSDDILDATGARDLPPLPLHKVQE